MQVTEEMSGDRWLFHYAPPTELRRHPSVRICSTRLISDGSPRLVLTASPGASSTLTAARFDEVRRVHQLVSHPRLPVVAERGRRDGIEYLAFECPAMADGNHVLRQLAERGLKLSYAASGAFISGIREAMQAAHAVVDPVTGKRLAFGRVCYGNLLFDADGRYWLLALGKNLLTELDSGAPSGELSFHAPEVAAGGPASPGGDYFALLLLMRSLLPYVEVPARIGRVLRGDLQADDEELLRGLMWFDQRILAAPAPKRATVEEAVAMSARVRELLGTGLDHDGFAAAVQHALGRDSSPLETATLVVGPEGRWFRPLGGPLIDLEPHSAQRRILIALVDAHEEGRSLTVPDLIRVGWPGEQVAALAGANRVYVAIATLRRHGLRGFLQRKGKGYRLAPGVAVEQRDKP